MAIVSSPKNERINIRTPPAEQTLADRRVFVLDECQWDAFEAALARPVERKPALERLLSEPGRLD